MINDSLILIQMILLLLLVGLALGAIHTHALRHAVIYLGVYSLISSLIYLLYGAADVAITEAIIGCTLSTILFLVALKKYLEQSFPEEPLQFVEVEERSQDVS